MKWWFSVSMREPLIRLGPRTQVSQESLHWYILAGVVTKCMFVCLCCTVRPNKSKHDRMEQGRVYCRAKQGEWVAYVQKPGTLQWVSESICKGQVREGDCRICD